MDYRVLDSRAEILRVRRELRRVLTTVLPVVQHRPIGYPSGSIAAAPARFEAAGQAGMLWWHRFLSSNGGVDVNLFGLNDTSASASMNISFQFNYPLGGLIRDQGGVFIKDQAGAIVLAHRAIMTRRHRVARDDLIQQLQHRSIEVNDGDRTSTVLVIASLQSPSLVEDLRNFGREARRAVDRVVNGVRGSLGGKPSTTFSLPSAKLRDYFDEFFGKRSRGAVRTSSGAADCEHGAIVKALEQQIPEKCVKSGHVDLAVDKGRYVVIIEVKTSTSAQAVYTGLGQLLYHAEVHRARGKRVVRCLVLPRHPDAHAMRLIAAAMEVKYVMFERHLDGSYSFDGLAQL